MFEKSIVIDASGHILGRLAATVAKEILNGQHVVIVRAENINLTGSFPRNKLKYMKFLRKRIISNPSHGFKHFRAPSKIFWRTVRGMVPHKTARGAAALERMKVFDGMPAPYDKVKRVVVPHALRVLRLRPDRKFCTLGKVSSQVGWKYADVVERLEAKRKVKSFAYYQKKKQLMKLKAKAVAEAGQTEAKQLAALGY